MCVCCCCLLQHVVVAFDLKNCLLVIVITIMSTCVYTEYKFPYVQPLVCPFWFLCNFMFCALFFFFLTLYVSLLMVWFVSFWLYLSYFWYVFVCLIQKGQMFVLMLEKRKGSSITYIQLSVGLLC